MRALFAVGYLSSTALLVACGGGSDTPVVNTTQNVSIQFAAQAQGKDVKCGAVNEVSNLGTTNKTAELQDLRFYISELHLINSQGQAVAVTLDKNEYQNYGLALLDFEDATGSCVGDAKTNTAISGKIATGNYTGIKFTLGVTDQGVDNTGKAVILNHSDTTVMAAPLDIASMGWMWQNGRRFAKIELKPTGGVTNTTDGTTANVWPIHMGATGCTGSDLDGYSCTNPNLAIITLSGFNVSQQKVVLDVAALLSKSDIAVNQNGALGCMSGGTDKECPAIFDALGLDLATGKTSTTKTQTAFKVVNK